MDNNKGVGNKIEGATGVIGVIVAALAWLGITPEMIGEHAYYIFSFTCLAVLGVSAFFLGRWSVDRRLDSRISALEKQSQTFVTQADVDLSINTFVEEVCDATKSSDDKLKDKVRSGIMPKFDSRVLSEVLEMPIAARCWIKDAFDQGYVDIDNRALDYEDHEGHFRRLVTVDNDQLTDENGYQVTRYVLNKGVSGVLGAYPELFDRVDEYREEIRAIGRQKPYDPATAKYQAISSED